MSAGVLNYNLQQMLRNFATQPDPGASGTLSISDKGLAIFEVVTAGAESRALESAAFHPVGATCVVIGKTLVGALSVTGAATGTKAITGEGDYAVFKVTDNDGTKEWRLEASSDAIVAFGTVSIGTGDADADALILAMANIMIAKGWATGTLT